MTLGRELSATLESVEVVDRHEFGAATSSAAAGMLAALVEARLEEEEHVRFGVRALSYWHEFAEQIEQEAGESIGFDTTGTLFVAVDRDHVDWIAHFLDEFHALDLDVNDISGEQVRELEPYVSSSVSRGILSKLDAQVDNRALIRVLVNLLRSRDNVFVRENCSVASIERIQGGWTVRTDDPDCADGCLEAERVVVATGPSLNLLEPIMPGISRNIRPVRGEVMRLDQSATPLVSHVLRTPDVYLVPKQDGSLVVGATSEERGFETRPTLGALYGLSRAAWEVVPGTAELPVSEISAGFRPASIDHKPIAGPCADGLYVATGYYRHGIMVAPLIARLLSDCILEEKEDEHLTSFYPDRFNKNSG